MAELEELPKVKLSRDTINFKKGCVDPMAQAVVDEVLDFAIRDAQKKLKRVGEVFQGSEDSGIEALAVVNAIREELASYPTCDIKYGSLVEPTGGKPPVITTEPTSFEETLRKKVKPEMIVQLERLANMNPEYEKAIIEGVNKGLTEQQLFKFINEAITNVKGASPATPAPTTKKKVVEPRTLPGRWQRVEYFPLVGQPVEFKDPSEAARALGVNSKGAANMINAFRRAGFEVTGNGEPKKGVGRFKVIQTKTPIPKEYQLPAPIAPAAAAETKEERPLQLIEIFKQQPEGKEVLVGYDVLNEEGEAGARLGVMEAQALIKAGKAEVQ